MAVLSDQLRVEFGYGSTPSTSLGSVSWTDVTSSVRLVDGVSFNRGRSGKDTVARPGTLTFTLDNSQQKGAEGRFTLGGANQVSGLALRIPVRVRVANVSGSTYTLWVGYVESLSTGWVNGWRPVVKVSATDRLARLQRRSLPSLVLGTQVNVLDAVLAYPLDEPAGSLTFGNRTKTLGAPIFSATGSTGVMDVGVVPGPGGDRTGVTFTGGTMHLVASGVDAVLGASSALWVEAYVKPTAGSLRVFSMEDSAGRYASVVFNGGGLLLDYQFGSGGAYPTASSAIINNEWNHVALYMAYSSGTTTMVVYVNGVDELTEFASASALLQPQTVRIGMGKGFGQLVSNDGSIANFAMYPTVAPAYSLDQLTAARNGRAGDTSTVRFQTVATVADVADYTTVGTAGATMAASQFNGRQLLDVINDIATTEQGVAYVDRNGTLTLAARTTRYNPTASFTIPATAVQADTDFDTDMSFVINDVTVGRPDGITYRATNDTSVAAYETHDENVTIYPNTDDQVVDTANWLANIEATPKPRVTDISVDLDTAANVVSTASLVQAEVGQMFQVTGLPSASTPAATLSLFVEGVSDRVTEKSWSRTFNTSPVATGYGVWKLGDSTLSVLDSTTRLAF